MLHPLWPYRPAKAQTPIARLRLRMRRLGAWLKLKRQRIALARVILKNAPILILDEATSALDSEVENAIQQQLLGLMTGKTVIAIAHRLSTIARLDRLVVLEEGRIAEMGSHDELLAKKGVYARLWALQSGGFLPTAEVGPTED